MPSHDPTTYERVRGIKYAVHFLALAADTRRNRLYAGGTDRGIHVFDLANEEDEPAARWDGHENFVSSIALRPGDTNEVLSCGFDRRLIWWDAERGKIARSVEAHDGWARDLAVSHDGAWIATVGDDMLVKLWDAESGQLAATLSGHAPRTPQGHVSAMYRVAISGDGSMLAAADRVGEVRVWEASSMRQVSLLCAPTLYTYDPVQRKRSIGGVRALAFSRDGKKLVVGGVGQIENVDGIAGPVHVEMWDWSARKRLQEFHSKENSRGMANDVLFAEDDGWFACVGGGSDGGFLAFWREGGADPIAQHKLDGHLRRLAASDDRSTLYLAGYELIEVWRAV